MIRATSPTPGSQPPLALDPAEVVVLLDAVGSEDAITAIIAAKTADIERIAGGAFWHRTYEERREGSGTASLYLQARPVTAVASVQLGGDGDPIDAEDFEIWDEQLYLSGCATWTQLCCPQWVTAYTGGWWIHSMGAPPPEARILADERADILAVITDMVATQWAIDQSDRSIKRAKLDKLEVEFFGNIAVSSSSISVLQSLVPVAY